MSRIIISTNGTLRELYSDDSKETGARTGYAGEYQKINDLNIRSLNYENPVLYYSEVDKKFKTTDENSKIILLNDSTPSDNPVSIFPNNLVIEDRRDYLLHHSREEKHIRWITMQKFISKILGMHSLQDKLYPKVFDIIFDEEESKAERIIEFLFPTADIILGKKLDLLHSLLVPTVNFVDANQKWSDIKKTVEAAKKSGIDVSFATDENALISFQNKVIGITDAFDPVYMKALTDLRDSLLPS